MALRRSRGKSSSSGPSEEDLSEWLPSKTLRTLTAGLKKSKDNQWSRILKFDKFMDDMLPSFSIEEDLKEHLEDRNELDVDSNEEENKVIDYDMSKSEIRQIDLSQEYIKEADLRLFAEKVIIIRKNILKKVETMENEEIDELELDVNGPPFKEIKLNRKFENRKRRRKQTPSKLTKELSMDRKYLKKRKLCDLSCSDQIDITHSVKLEGMSHENVAYLHHVKTRVVSSLMKKSEEDDQYLKKLQLREKEKLSMKKLIYKVAKEMYRSSDGIRRAEDVVDQLLEKEGVEVPLHQVYPVLKVNLNLQYRVLKRIAYQANSDRCLLQRQAFAKDLIDLLLRGYNIINADETWIGIKDYSRFRWRQRGVSNSTNVQAVSPRISLFVAMDQNGEIYFSLTQVNTDQDVKSLFLTYLAAKLDLERPGWRDNTMILMDNASYNRGEDTAKQIKKLRLPVMFTAPYSYEASPIERYFGYFKQGRILKPFESSGKRQDLFFVTIKQGVINRMKTMRKSANIMFWHNTCKVLYEYLSFKRL